MVRRVTAQQALLRLQDISADCSVILFSFEHYFVRLGLVLTSFKVNLVGIYLFYSTCILISSF